VGQKGGGDHFRQEEFRFGLELKLCPKKHEKVGRTNNGGDKNAARRGGDQKEKREKKKMATVNADWGEEK